MYNTGVTSYQRGESNIFENSASFALTSFIFLSGSHDLTHVAVIVGVSGGVPKLYYVMRLLFVIVSFDHCFDLLWVTVKVKGACRTRRGHWTGTQLSGKICRNGCSTP